MIGVSAIQRIDPRVLTASAPALSDYDSVSAGWREQEYRATFPIPQVEGGYWTGEAGSVSFRSWPYTELCVILAGRVAVEDAAGDRAEFGAGESFMIPQGFCGVWHTLEATEKVFIGITADSPAA